MAFKGLFEETKWYHFAFEGLIYTIQMNYNYTLDRTNYLVMLDGEVVDEEPSDKIIKDWQKI